MWVIDQKKNSIINLNQCVYIGFYDYGKATIEVGTPTANIIVLGEFKDKTHANEIFELLLSSIGRGDNLFVMPEEK